MDKFYILDILEEALLAEGLQKCHHSIWPFCIVGAYCNGFQMTISKDTQKLQKHNLV